MPNRRTPIWLTLIFAAVGLLAVGLPGLWVFMGMTAERLHPKPQEVPSAAGDAVAPRWGSAAERARQVVRAGLAEQNLPGLSVAVGLGEDVVWTEGFGFANLEDRVPVTPDHRFRIGTASVVLTSAGAGLLLERGRLKLDEEIQTYVPAFPKKEWPLTLRQTMAHLAGLRNDGGDEGPLFGERCEQPVEALQHFAERPLLSEPGTKFRFSSYGWILVSAAMEAAAGKPFLSFMQEQVFERLRMPHTRADSATDPQRVTHYFPRFASDPKYGLHLMRDLEYSCYAGASVFVSTPRDLVRFGIAILNGKLLQTATVRLLQTSERTRRGEQTGYGLGWDVETVTVAGKQTTALGHDGDLLGGRAASLWTFPEHGIVVAVLSNIAYADTFSLATKIADAFAAQ